MAEFHFVQDYEKLVERLVSTLPLDEAMSVAVGGSYEGIGRVEFDIVSYFGLRRGDSVVDLGCGSGRLASVMARKWEGDYLGLDVVQALLDYAKTKCPKHYRFVLNKSRFIPVDDKSTDMFFAFSVFTHLLHDESYIYLRDMHRGLKEGGKVVLSFLEFYAEPHWDIFQATVQATLDSTQPHLNQFIERSQIEVWARHIGFKAVSFVDGDKAPWPSNEAIGQSIAVLVK